MMIMPQYGILILHYKIWIIRKK